MMDIDIETKNFEPVIDFCDSVAGFICISGDMICDKINLVIKSTERAYEIREIGKGFVFTVWDISSDIKELCRIKTDHKRGKKAFIAFVKNRHNEAWNSCVEWNKSIININYENRPWER